MSEARRESPWPRLVVGLSLLTAGVLIWLDRIGEIDARQYLQWWPAALIAMGLSYLPDRRNWFAAFMWLLFGSFFLLPKFGVSRHDFWMVIGSWPLLISLAGATLVAQALKQGASARDFRAMAVWSGNVRKVGTQGFHGGEAIAVMGGCEIDLTGARINGEAVLDVLAWWGGIDITVPAGWRVVNQVMEILGAFEDKTTPPAAENAPRLVVRGSAIMAGIEVKTAEKAG
jgi:hypothetical protein